MATALRGAHVGGLNAAGEQPSIFDLVSQESLMKALKPAAGHLVRFLALTKGHRFVTAHRYYDELYLLFDVLLQNQYLKKYGASFSENFYAMKRVSTTTGTPPTGLPERLRSLAFLTLWPYLSDKLEKLHQRLAEKYQNTRNTATDIRTRLGKLFVVIWPWLKTILSTISTILQISYMINRSSIHSPFLAFSGVKLEKLTPDDLAAFDTIPMHLQQTGHVLRCTTKQEFSILNRLWRFFLSLPGILSRLFGYGLFFVQFIDFIYNSDLGSQLKKANAEWKTPAAPHYMLSETAVQSLETHKCPICCQKRKNDTALSVSGYVFCYDCISSHVKNNQTCPVTGLPASSQQLIRLYIQ